MKEKALAAMLAFVLVGGAGYLAVTSTGAEAHRSDPGGIPDDNPSHHPEDGDGECEKGETVIKTTPSGKRVNVPCQAGDDDDDDDDGESHGNGNGTSGGNDDDDEAGDDNDDGDDDGGTPGNGNGKGKNK